VNNKYLQYQDARYKIKNYVGLVFVVLLSLAQMDHEWNSL